MSGIAGIIGFDGQIFDAKLIESMTRSMDYRGPDGIYHWMDAGVALGQCMLRTTSESLHDTQPLLSLDNRFVLVMDGWLSNWQALRRTLLLLEVPIRNDSDAALVLASFQHWGESCVQQLEGDFAFVIWDQHNRRAFCARDRMGHKSLKYHWDGSIFSFATDAKPLLILPWIQAEPNKSRLAEFLAADMHTLDETLWTDIYRLKAAHHLTVGKEGLKPKRYWRPGFAQVPVFSTDDEYIAHYRQLLTETVRSHARAKEVVSIEVSGGLDSSSVMCLAELERRANNLHCPGLKAVSMTFEAGSDADELAYARIVGDYLSIDVEEYPATQIDLNLIENMAALTGEFPGFPNMLLNVAYQKSIAHRGGQVLLTGEGGDAWLQGDRSYYFHELVSLNWTALYRAVKADAAAFGIRTAFSWLLRYGCFELLPLAQKNQLRKLLRKELPKHTAPLASSGIESEI